MRFYNTLTRRLEEFREIEKGRIGLYTCGPTVYDFPHIGNFRSYVFEDLVKRFFRFSGFRVRHVMNITDIDDKTIRKANELGLPLGEVTRKYIDAFHVDLRTLNILPADVYPRATEHIPEMLQLVSALLAKGFAYKKEGSVYFSIERFKEYGRLANIDQGSLRTGAAVDADEYEKDAVQDFVLWKGRKAGEPFWPAAFGDGRPGWHIECSAMSMKYLGPHFDIHMGGVDNIFPHHENEIAQSECANGVKFVNYWLHCQHLIVDNRKMSKSLGNFFTLPDLLQRGADPMAVRYLLISTHYRKLLNFTFEGLEMAGQALQRVKNFAFSLKNVEAEGEADPELAAAAASSLEAFAASMADDFNVSGALGVMFDLIAAVNPRMNALTRKDAAVVREYLERVNSVLGVLEEKGEAALDAEIEERIRLRENARREKDFARADEIRAELKKQGIVLLDTPAGVKWKRE
ncbi:MAG: cysteine--tRNA ligase [Acidobacteria bacterium]|jgi:cysteinyl-tRNA synthetase|nr:cysteine--tRNA ligase [Acidobacteriota bacterium]